MTTIAIAAAQAATNMNSTDDTIIKANHRLSQTSNHSSASKRSKSHVGPWRLGRTLGRGSSGRVRLAKHALTGQLAAVKIVPKALSDDGNGNGNGGSNNANGNGNSGATQYGSDQSKDAGGLPYGIEREVIIMKLIEHPNVMALYDVWENKGELYLVLEYVEGGELFDYLIKKGRLDEREAINYFRQIIYGVDYCHKFNICHRDLKPENLLLDKNRNIKIADFGMAALETSDRMLETSCGSPHYASPEIVAGKNYHGAPSDIWSCGVILFALLTGHLPFDDDNIRKLLLKVQTGKFIMPSDISSEAQDLIWKMLRVDPNKRISMNEILRHPLLRKYPSGKKNMHHPRHHHTINPTFANADRPVKNVSEIDPEILKNLQILWHGASKQSVISKLLAPGPNSEKTFYCLLMKYRHDHLEDQHVKSKPEKDDLTKRQQHQHHRRRSSQISVTKKNIRTNTVSHSKNHSRNTSVNSVITASSSHRRNVAFVRKRLSSSYLKHNQSSGTSTPQQQQQSIQTDPLPIVKPKSIATTTPQLTPDEDFNFIDKRASVELASLCEHAFFASATSTVVEIPSKPSDRAVSDPISTIKPPKLATTEKRAFSLGEHEVNSVEPGSRPYSAYSTVSETSTTSTTTPYFLPMIFEEDRFADAIEEEVDLKIYKRPTSKAVEEDFDSILNNGFFRDKDIPSHKPKKRELVASSIPTQTHVPAKESSRLQISGLVKTESFKARSHTGFAAYRTPSAAIPVPKPNQNKKAPILSLSPPPSPKKSTNINPTKNSRNNTNPSPVTTKTIQPTKRTVATTNVTNASTVPPKPIQSSQPTRKPLAVKSNNIMITSNDSNSNSKSRDTSNGSSKTNAATSLFRKLTLNPRRPPPPPPPSTIQPLQNTRPAPAPPQQTASGTRTSSGKSNEVKQNWFMKMLNPQPQYSNSTTSSSKKSQATKTLFSTSSVTTMRHIIVEVLEDWQKYGISQINEDAVTSTVTAVISSRNVLSMRSSKFRINVYPMQGGTRAVFTQEKGSSTSFLRFLGELERALGEMEVLSPPRTEPRVPIGAR